MFPLFLSAALAAPTILGTEFGSNHGNQMAPNTMRLGVFVDSGTPAQLRIELSCPTGITRVTTPPLGGFSVDGVHTFLADLDDCEPTGRIEVTGVTPNGVVDGLAFGAFWKDAAGNGHLLKSNAARAGGNHVLGIWPLGWVSDESWLRANTPGFAGTTGLYALKGILQGAVLLDNGVYRYQIF